MIFVSDIFEVRGQQQVSNAFVFSIGVGDFLQELRTNDAARAEDLRDFTVVQIPVVFVRRGTQLRETLRVGDDFAQVQRATNFLNKLCFITSQFSLRARQHFRCRNALVFQRRDVAREYRLGDQRQRFAQIQRTLAGPFTGTFVRRFVQDHINKVFTLFIFFGEDVFGDVDQVAAQLAFIPLGKGSCQFFVRQVQTAFQQGIGFSNQLHIAIFDAVVNHLHVMACTVSANIGHARLAIFRNGCDFGQDRRNQLIRFFLATRHDRWTFQGTFFTAGYASTDEVKTFSGQFTVTTDSVLEEGVTTINDDVAFIQIRLQGIDSSISSRPCFNH